MILDKLFNFVLEKFTDAIPVKKPSPPDLVGVASGKVDPIKIVVINAGDEIYHFENNVLTYKSRPQLNCGGNHFESALIWDEKRYFATDEQSAAIVNEANLISELLLVDNVKIENESLVISYAYNNIGYSVTKGTEKLFDVFRNIMGYTHFYPEKREANSEPQLSKKEQELLDKLKADKRRLTEIKEKYGEKYEPFSTAKARTGSYQWTKDVRLSIDDVIELCNHLSAAHFHIFSIFCSSCSGGVDYYSIEEYHRVASRHYVNAREEYTSCIVMKSDNVHVHIKMNYGENHTYISKNIVHDAELIVFCDSGCIFPSTVAKYEEIKKNIEEYLVVKCCP